jgi:hypothetical protein
MVVWLVLWLCTWEILSVYISEASSWHNSGLCVGDFHNAKEYNVFRIMVYCSLVVGGFWYFRGTLVPTDQGTTWYPLIRYIAFIHSLKVEGVSASKALISHTIRRDVVMHKATIYYHIYFLVASCLCVCTRQVICITKHLQCLLFDTDFDLSCMLDLRTYLQ